MRNLYSYEKSYSSTSDLPFGAFKNESSAGAKDGTDIVAEHMQDLYYSIYQILQLAGMKPNGELEDGNTSKQFISALTKITTCVYSAAIKYAKNAIVLNIVSDTISVYKSLIDENTNVLTNSDAWILLAKISPEGVFGNMTINSPTLTGTPTTPTAATGTATTQIASCAFVKNSFKNFIKITTGNGTNGTLISPPSGFSMSDLVAFMPAISNIYYSGSVDYNDSTYCTYTTTSTHIKLTVYSSEQRAATRANWIAVWIKS